MADKVFSLRTLRIVALLYLLWAIFYTVVTASPMAFVWYVAVAVVAAALLAFEVGM